MIPIKTNKQKPQYLDIGHQYWGVEIPEWQKKYSEAHLSFSFMLEGRFGAQVQEKDLLRQVKSWAGVLDDAWASGALKAESYTKELHRVENGNLLRFLRSSVDHYCGVRSGMEPSRNRGSHPEGSGRSGNSEQHFSKASYSLSHWVLRTQMSFASLSGKSNIEHIPSWFPLTKLTVRCKRPYSWWWKYVLDHSSILCREITVIPTPNEAAFTRYGI